MFLLIQHPKHQELWILLCLNTASVELCLKVLMDFVSKNLSNHILTYLELCSYEFHYVLVLYMKV